MVKNKAMNVDVILCTYNRAHLLEQAIGSFLACLNDTVQARLIITDNNSTDATRVISETYVQRFPGTIEYLFESRQGKHHALNTAIGSSQSDVVAFYDDDEILDSNWLRTIHENFHDSNLDFVAGEVRLKWDTEQPSWYPAGYNGVLGSVRHGLVRRRYWCDGFDAMLTGGNWAVRRPVLDRCGPYSPDHMYAEDRYMHMRMQAIGAHGIYDPSMIVFHVVPQKRLTRSYFRHWAYTEGRTIAHFARAAGEGGATLLGAPLWRWRQAGAAGLRMVTDLHKRDDSAFFTAQLNLVEFWGLLSFRFSKERYVDRSGFQK